jgi:hypothetical protein
MEDVDGSFEDLPEKEAYEPYQEEPASRPAEP